MMTLLGQGPYNLPRLKLRQTQAAERLSLGTPVWATSYSQVYRETEFLVKFYSSEKKNNKKNPPRPDS